MPEIQVFVGSAQICLSAMHAGARTHKQTHAGIAATGGRMKMKEREGRRGGGGEKPMWQREILIFSESADPPLLRCSLHRSLPVTHHTNLSSTSFFLLPPFRAASFLFLSPPPYTLLILPSYSLLFGPPLSAFTVLYYHSFCIPPPSSSLTVGELQADRSSIH